MSEHEYLNLEIVHGNELKDIKRVFTTNVFVPMEGNISNKTYNYLTGFIKLVETFKVRTKFDDTEADKKWYLYIYYDSMFDQEYDETKYAYAENNNEYNKTVKNIHAQTSISIQKLLKLYKLYIEHIKSDPQRYNFIKLISYKVIKGKIPGIDKYTEKYLGYPKTLGSFVRFEPLYDKTLEYVFIINISHAITPNMMRLIDSWLESGKICVCPLSYYFQNLRNHPKIDMLNRKYNWTRLAAGLFGIKTLDSTIKNYYTDIKELKPLDFAYGIDEIILTNIVFNYISTIEKYRYIYESPVFDIREFAHTVKPIHKVMSVIGSGHIGNMVSLRDIYGKIYTYINKKYEDDPEANITQETMNNDPECKVDDALINDLIYHRFGKLKDDIETSHRALSQSMINKVFNKNTEIIEYFEGPVMEGDFSFYLNGYDEKTPLLIINNFIHDNRELSPDDYQALFYYILYLWEYYDVIKIDDYELDEMNELFKSLLDYYQHNIKLQPYSNALPSSGGGFKIKNKIKRKTSKRRKKNNKRKSKINKNRKFIKAK